MRERLEEYFRSTGYKKLYTDQEGWLVYFLEESGFVTVCAMLEDPEGNYSDYRKESEKIRWRFSDSGWQQVHLLTILLTDDVSKAMEAAADDRFCWAVDLRSRQLVILPDAVENFYGLRSELEAVLAPPHYTSRYLEEPLEYEAGGKLCIRHIGQRPIVNHALLILNLMGYILCLLFPVAIYNWGDLRFSRVFGEGEWYRLFSHLFLHADPAHLTGNLLMLLLIGDITERAVGHLKYLILYICGGLFAAGVSMYVSYWRGSDIGSIGASGAIFSVVGLLLWVILRNSGKLEMLTTKKMLFLIAYTLYFGFTSTGVDNAAHVGGLIGGFLGGILFYRKRKGSAKEARKGETA